MKALTLFILVLLFASCASRKHTVNTNVKEHQVIHGDSSFAGTRIIETTTYGDTLQGNSFIANDTDSISVESAGIKLKIKVTPKRDSSGHTIGHSFNYQASAKPTAKTNIHETQQSNVQQTTKSDTHTKTVAKELQTGWRLPSWIWWLAGLIAAIALVVFFNPVLTFIKSIWKF